MLTAYSYLIFRNSALSALWPGGAPPRPAQISNGSLIEINETGTRMRLVPGLLVGGTHLEHECHASRSIGYYLEALASLAPFAKHATEITLRGVTNDDRDPSVQ